MSKALADLSARLRRLHREAGEPTTRVIGRAIGYSHTTVAKALRGGSCPSWMVLEKIVAQLRGDVHEFKRLWILARDELAPLPPVPGSCVDSEPTLAMAVESSPSYIRSESHPVIARVDPNTGNVEFVMSPEVGLKWMMNLRNSKGGEEGDE
ncbi:helix-turn-helix domain-containing protein [Streptomyces sp. NPDC002386]